jgi:hypothetical protein
MPKLDTAMAQSVEIGVIASPIRITGGTAGSLGPTNDIAIRIENAHLRNRTVGEPLLSPSFAQEACRDEGGVLFIVLPQKDRGSFGLSHGRTSVASGGFLAASAIKAAPKVVSPERRRSNRDSHRAQRPQGG